jgi:hypothetical protein
MTRFRLIILLAFVGLMVGVIAVLMNQRSFAETLGKVATTDKLELLFVQNGTAGTFDGTRLTLEGVGPTMFFTDRPNRIGGHMRTARLISEWGKGPDNFVENPPNASLSIFQPGGIHTALVELYEPKLEGNTLSYRIKVLGGEVPSKFKEASLFIDMFGRGAAFVGGMAIGHAITRARQPTYVVQPTVVTQPDYSYQARTPPPCVCNCR